MVSAVGIVAGLTSTASFAPQVWKAWREPDTEAISLPTYIVTVTGFTIWIAYAFLIGNWVIIGFNTLSLVMAGAILTRKVINRERGRDAT
jgi:MtN3 and saliva related transmembrane protein